MHSAQKTMRRMMDTVGGVGPQHEHLDRRTRRLMEKRKQADEAKKAKERA